MLVEKAIKFDGDTRGAFKDAFQIPDECPRCHFAITPKELAFGGYINNNGDHFASGLYLCTHCYQTFLTLYKCTIKISSKAGFCGFTSSLLYLGPESLHDCECPDSVKKAFPRFYKIYNQAHKADSLGLDEIAGIGYRKAVEILVKDYCLLTLPDDKVKEKIPSMPLSQCINLIPYEPIRTLALGSAWLGNDETHYERKHVDHDLEDLKRFVKALIFFVSADLAVSDASSLCAPKP